MEFPNDFVPAGVTSVVVLVIQQLINAKWAEKFRSQTEKELEAMRARLKAESDEVEALRGAVLSGILARDSIRMQRQVQAIDGLWSAVQEYGKARGTAAMVSTLNYDYIRQRVGKDPRMHDFLNALAGGEITFPQTVEADRARPFVTPLAWQLFQAYRTILIHAIVRLMVLKNAWDGPPPVDYESIRALLVRALPELESQIIACDIDGFHVFLNDLEERLLNEFSDMLAGRGLDAEAAERARDMAAISREMQDKTEAFRRQTAP